MRYYRACLSVVVVVVAIGRMETLTTKAQYSRKWGLWGVVAVADLATRFLPKPNIIKAGGGWASFLTPANLTEEAEHGIPQSLISRYLIHFMAYNMHYSVYISLIYPYSNLTVLHSTIVQYHG